MAGQVIILNGAPRSGKSSIALEIQATFPGVWMNLGVDAWVTQVTPLRYRPGIGLRPGGERPDLEPLIATMYAALYESIAAHSRLGLNVVTDAGHHDDYSAPLHTLEDGLRRLAGLPVMVVGVRCPLDVIMQRRRAGQTGREGGYLTGTAADPYPAPVLRWEEAVHAPGRYDVEVDTSLLSPAQCAATIREAVQNMRPPA